VSRLPLLLFFLMGLSASAQTALPCVGTCPVRYYFESQPCSSGTCARSYAPLPSEFTAGKGMSLASLYEGASIEICAAYGQTLTGTGTLRVWTWYPWLSGDVSTAKPVELNVADVWVDSACGYTTQADGGVVSGVSTDGGSNTSYDCRCAHWTDWKMGGYSARRVLVQAVDVGVSGGSSLEVRLVGLETIR
jgi:hypothetical protein